MGNYANNEIPPNDHLVIAASGTQKELEYRLPGRRVIKFGGFGYQNLDFYLIARGPGEK